MGLSVMGWCRQMQEKSHHLPLLDKFQQQLQDNNDGSDNTAGGSDSGSLEGSPAAATGSVFGAVTLITGTSVGAGILALPATTAPAVSILSMQLFMVDKSSMSCCNFIGTRY
jgi:hypothetical protein